MQCMGLCVNKCANVCVFMSMSMCLFVIKYANETYGSRPVRQITLERKRGTREIGVWTRFFELIFA